jgi:hypothetical protein
MGEKAEHPDPIFSVCRSSIIRRSSLVVEVYGDPDEEYQIEGSFPQRCCAIYKTYLAKSSRDPVAEIKRKLDPSTNVMLGKDVFLLLLKPGFDSALAMGLVLILDQMYGDDADDRDADETGHTLEDSSS